MYVIPVRPAPVDSQLSVVGETVECVMTPRVLARAGNHGEEGGRIGVSDDDLPEMVMVCRL